MTVNYWLVGAKEGGTDDVLPLFLKRGYWYCWEPGPNQSTSTVGNSVLNQQKRFLQIKTGDRIAVKSMLGQGSTQITILALGIVKDIDPKEWRIYIDWLPIELGKRIVDINGATASIHGPYKVNNPWIQQIFCI